MKLPDVKVPAGRQLMAQDPSPSATPCWHCSVAFTAHSIIYSSCKLRERLLRGQSVQQNQVSFHVVKWNEVLIWWTVILLMCEKVNLTADWKTCA